MLDKNAFLEEQFFNVFSISLCKKCKNNKNLNANELCAECALWDMFPNSSLGGIDILTEIHKLCQYLNINTQSSSRFKISIDIKEDKRAYILLLKDLLLLSELKELEENLRFLGINESDIQIITRINNETISALLKNLEGKSS